MPSFPLLIAHRGASGDAPENTLAAFAAAWVQAADGIECDVRCTQDGRVVVMHDADTGRVARQRLEVAASSWEDLRRLDIGSWKHPRFGAERIPLLDEVLEQAPPGGRVFIEIKSGPSAVKPVARVLAAAPVFPEDLVVMSFDPETVALASRMIPDILPMLLVDFPSAESPGGVASVQLARQCFARGIGWQCGPAISAEAVRAGRDAGMMLSSWTVNEPREAARLAGLGLDALTTDWPSRIRRELGPRGFTPSS